MKKSVFLATLALTGFSYIKSEAQVGVHIGVNFGTPVYAPAPVYTPAPVDEEIYQDDDDYYYLPDADAYYSVPERVYYYMNGTRWVSAAYLPGRYHDLDWRYARRYEIRGSRPYLRHEFYRSRYSGFTGGNPNWRTYDSRFRNGGFNGPGSINAGSYGYARRQDGNFGRRDDRFEQAGRGQWRDRQNADFPARPSYGNGQPDNYDRGNGNQSPRRDRGRDWSQQGGSGWNRDNNGNNSSNQGGYNRPGRPSDNQGQYGQPGQGRQPNDNQPQRGPGRSDQPNGNQDWQGRGNRNNEVRSRLADINGPNYDRQNGSIRPGRF